MDVYKSVSRQIHEIFHEYTDIIEPLSLDEAFLDVTENKKGISLAVDIAKEIKLRIREQLNLVASDRIFLGSRTCDSKEDAFAWYSQWSSIT